MKRSFFISHSSEDKALARRFKRLLEASNCEVWIDEQNINYGSVLLESIDSGVKEVTDFILLASDDSMKSSYVWEELHIARERCESGNLRAYAVKITKKTSLPLWLDKLVYLSLEGPDLKNRLAKFFTDATAERPNELLLEELMNFVERQSSGDFAEGYNAASSFYSTRLEALRILVEHTRPEEFEKLRDQILKLGVFSPKIETRSTVSWLHVAPGVFEMIFASPMRVPPVIELTGVPENIEYKISHVSNVSAQISFKEKTSGMPTNDIPFLKIRGALNSEL